MRNEDYTRNRFVQYLLLKGEKTEKINKLNK